VDYWHFEENLIAGYASPTSLSTPWEMLAAMDDLVFEQRRAAYSDTAASRFNVPWISLVMERDARLVERTLKQLERESAVPEGVFEIGQFSLVSRADAAARYRAAIDWFDTYGHLVISNGPFYLSKYDPPAQFAEILAFRDPTYPYKAGDWYIGGIEPLEIDSPGSVELSPGRDEEIRVHADGPGGLGIRFVFVDPVVREVIYASDAERTSAGEFTVLIPGDVTEDLFPGLYQLSLVVYSDTLATVTDRLIDVDVLE
jgi:peptide/nickel transport system substrate-binding protein